MNLEKSIIHRWTQIYTDFSKRRHDLQAIRKAIREGLSAL
jgi:hypothetical protein